MRGGWAGPAPAPLPPLGARAAARLLGRAAAVALVTAWFLGRFGLLRGIDAARRRRGAAARAPAAVQAWARAVLPLAGLRIEVVGRPMAGPGALVANHAGWLDIVVLMAAARLSFVAKAEVRNWPVIGTFARAIGTVFVERRPLEARRQGEALRRLLARGERLAIFPEGTSTDGLRVLPFKSSLFEVFFAPGLRETLWVQPVTLAYRPPPSLPPTFYGWWGEADLAGSLRDVLARSVGGRVVLVFHEPLRVADFPDRKTLAARAEADIRAMLAERLADAAGRVPCL